MRTPSCRSTLLLAFLMATAFSSVTAEVEIDLGDAPEAKPTPAAAAPVVVATPTPAPAAAAVVAVDDDEEEGNVQDQAEVYEEKPATPTPTKPTVTEVRGVMKMRDYYEAGIQAYQAQEYEKAIRYLEQALRTKDPYTKDYYYAEANAMLGVIYQFYFTVPGSREKAYRYYREALRIDPATETARKYIRQVRPR